MKKDLTLVIMAAGMGSRFGGLKQIEPIGPNDEFITDYSVYDAYLSGIKKVVFIIKKENLEIFEETIGKRIKNKVDVEYAFQDKKLEFNGNIIERDKPWGTAHAIFSAKDRVDSNFIVINSDDFYGRDAFKVAREYFENEHQKNEFALVGYQVKNTLTENGSVKRGICKEENGCLKDIIESKVIEDNGVIKATPLSGKEEFEVSSNDLVSMNMLLFTPYIFELIDKYKDKFLDSGKSDLDNFEYLIPDLLKECLKNNEISVKVLKTNAKWEGVTYKEDKEQVVNAIRKLVEDGEYKENLWED